MTKGIDIAPPKGVTTNTTLSFSPPGPVAASFMKSDAFVRCILGPFGSGKSVACCMEVFRRCLEQRPNPKGVRRSRWAVIRNTYGQLRTTTVKTWREWIGDEWGQFTWATPFTHNLDFVRPDDNTRVSAEILFLALDRPKDVQRLLSLELTGLWINEAREMTKANVDNAIGRCKRYPREVDGGYSWSGAILDTNPPAEDHWWPIMAGDVPPPEWMTEEEKRLLVQPPEWAFFHQPGAMIERRENDELMGFDMNPERENQVGIRDDYYTSIISGKDPGWIKIYVCAQYGETSEGKPVYRSFREHHHVAKHDLRVRDGVRVVIGMDFGRTPTAVMTQEIDGVWYIVSELLGVNLGITEFLPLLKRWCARHQVLPATAAWYGDPAGDHLTEVGKDTSMSILRANGIPIRPAPSNDPVVRIEAVRTAMSRLVNGAPGLIVSPACKDLVRGFKTGYRYKRLQVSGLEQYEEEPEKNRFSHPHDALQYALVGAGEGRVVMRGDRPEGALRSITAPKAGSILDRMRSKPARVRVSRFRRGF